MRLADRLDDFSRDFALCVDMSASHLVPMDALRQHAKLSKLIAYRPQLPFGYAPKNDEYVIGDEEILPFAPQSLDAVLSVLSWQWINDLPGLLTQIYTALKPDGLLLVNLAGTETLSELRSCLVQAESALTQGMSPRVSPFIDIKSAGGLLQRAGFALPVVDSEIIKITYDSMFALMQDLRDSGQTNALAARSRTPATRGLFHKAATFYVEQFSTAQGQIVASFELITLTAFKPSDTQQKPAKRGSGSYSFEEAGNT